MEIEEFFGEQFHHWRERFRYYEMAITELESDLGIIDLDWQTRLGYSPIEHVKTRMKTLPSIVRKMKQKELPLEVDALWNHVHDVAGVRIVTSFRDDIYAILDHLKKRDDLQIDENQRLHQASEAERIPEPPSHRPDESIFGRARHLGAGRDSNLDTGDGLLGGDGT